MPEPTKTPSAPRIFHHHRRIGGSGHSPGGEQHDRQFACAGDLRNQLVRRLQLLGRNVQLVVVLRRQRPDLNR